MYVIGMFAHTIFFEFLLAGKVLPFYVQFFIPPSPPSSNNPQGEVILKIYTPINFWLVLVVPFVLTLP